MKENMSDRELVEAVKAAETEEAVKIIERVFAERLREFQRSNSRLTISPCGD